MDDINGFPENIAVLAKTVFNCGFAHVRISATPEEKLSPGDREACAISHVFSDGDTDSDYIIIQDAVYHPDFRNLPCVTNTPYLRFFAEYRMKSDIAGLCSLYIADIAPRTAFSPREKDILKSLTTLVVDAAERRIAGGKDNKAVSAAG